MEVIQTKIDPASPEFKENEGFYLKIVDDLKRKLDTVRRGGDPDLIEKSRERGKMLVRERIEGLLDAETPFMELSTLAALDMYNNEAPSAGIVTGIGYVHGMEVMVIANDATVKGGT